MLSLLWNNAVRELEADVDEPLDVQTICTPNRVIVRVAGDAGLKNVSRLEAELTNLAITRPPIVTYPSITGAKTGSGALLRGWCMTSRT